GPLADCSLLAASGRATLPPGRNEADTKCSRGAFRRRDEPRSDRPAADGPRDRATRESGHSTTRRPPGARWVVGTFLMMRRPCGQRRWPGSMNTIAAVSVASVTSRPVGRPAKKVSIEPAVQPTRNHRDVPRMRLFMVEQCGSEQPSTSVRWYRSTAVRRVPAPGLADEDWGAYRPGQVMGCTASRARCMRRRAAMFPDPGCPLPPG